MDLEVNRDELVVEVPPQLRQLAGQVLIDVKIGPDEVAGETLRCVDALAAQHDSVIGVHGVRACRFMASRTLPALFFQSVYPLALCTSREISTVSIIGIIHEKFVAKSLNIMAKISVSPSDPIGGNIVS
jgi:hypothetical protein